MKVSPARAAALLPLAVLVIAVARPAGADPTPMATAARAWLEALTPELRAQATFAVDDAERRNWHFVPREYEGVALGEMDLAQRRAAHALLRSALSSRGYLEATTVMLLEQVLRDAATAAGQPADHRDPERYWFAVFGDPAPGQAWGWRVQGHHLSLNFTVADGVVAAVTPAFLGANPAEVRSGPFTGLRALGRKEDLARQLLASLDPEQRGLAVRDAPAPADVILAPGRALDGLGAPAGLAAGAMSAAQRAQLHALVEEYAQALRPDSAAAQLARIDADGFDGVHFLWIGATDPGQPHYFRIHGAGFAIEYDNVQNGANHAHTVWHDLRDPFAADALRRHHELHHRGR